MTLRNRTVLLLTEMSNWLGASRTVGSKYGKNKCLKAEPERICCGSILSQRVEI